jgi:predicted anti-sigma-YlaC factor YlaD
MECREFIDLLEELLAERLPEESRRAALEHAQECARCSELVMAADDPSFDLAGSILRRTSGSTCRSARRLLCDELDGEIERIDSELLMFHLDGCTECAALSRSLAALASDLPMLSEIAPDDRFLGEVLARTLPAQSPAGRWASRLALGMQQLLRRPRFAMEGAYIGTLVLLLIFGAQSALLAQIPRRALELTDVGAVVELTEPVAQLQTTVTSRASFVWETAVMEITRLSDATAETVKRKIGTFKRSLASEQETDEQEQETDDERQ